MASGGLISANGDPRFSTLRSSSEPSRLRISRAISTTRKDEGFGVLFTDSPPRSQRGRPEKGQSLSQIADEVSQKTTAAPRSIEKRPELRRFPPCLKPDAV